MFQPVAAFPSIIALKEGELRHLNPEVLAYTNTHPYTHNTSFSLKGPEIDTEHDMLIYAENL